MSKPFTVILLRPEWFILEEIGDFRELNDLMYVALVHAETELEAMRTARKETLRVDKLWLRKLDSHPYFGDHDANELALSDYTILGTAEGHKVFTPCLNQPR